VVRGNVVRDTLTPYDFALHTDYGTAWVTVEDNAVQPFPIVQVRRKPLLEKPWGPDEREGDPGTVLNRVVRVRDRGPCHVRLVSARERDEDLTARVPAGRAGTAAR
jgi:hypothetical protein